MDMSPGTEARLSAAEDAALRLRQAELVALYPGLGFGHNASPTARRPLNLTHMGHGNLSLAPQNREIRTSGSRDSRTLERTEVRSRDRSRDNFGNFSDLDASSDTGGKQD